MGKSTKVILLIDKGVNLTKKDSLGDVTVELNVSEDINYKNSFYLFIILIFTYAIVDGFSLAH